MPNTAVTQSELVYIFADKLISQRANFVNTYKLPSGERLPVKVLAQSMVLAAWAELVNRKLITLAIKDIKKLLLFSGKEIFAKKLVTDQKSELSGIEKILISNIDQETKVRDAVYNLLSEDESSPWGQIIYLNKKSLIAKGLLNQEGNQFDQAEIKKLQSKFSLLQQQFDHFSFTGETLELLNQAIKKGMNARVERAEGADFD